MSSSLAQPLALTALMLSAVIAPNVSGDDIGNEFFERQVRPILVARCFECHSDKTEKPKGNLRLDSRSGALKGGDTGPAIVPGKAKDSLLVDAINYGELYQMPPKNKLPAEEIAALTKWIESGAPWPAAKSQESGARGPDSNKGFDLAQRKAEHWCWRPIVRPPVPAIQNPKSKIQNPIDAFILAKLEEHGLSPAPPADQRTLIRRAYFDLIGLPPSAKELADVGSYEALVDHLLASSHFGERWARHWLDLVRYAESRGHEFDYDTPNAFEYRDYVIRALNSDLPYDQFVIEQIAGDLLEKPRLHPTERFNESIIGTGFWFLGEWCHSPVDIRKDECDRLDNMLDVFSKTFLGVTVACARCHDHKFDAISQRDYYALAGYLQSSSYRLTRFETWQSDRQLAAELAALNDKYRPQIAAAVVALLRPRINELAKSLAENSDALNEDVGVLEADLRGSNVIVDYANLPAKDWMADGPTFGSGPVQAGQILLTGDNSAPLEVVRYGAARRDSAWGDLGLAEGSQNDPGRLAGWVRAGRTLKTPTFTLESGHVHYLIDGAAHVYACVDSHAMINGPLHAELLKETGGNSDVPTRWITHDLSRYVGERMHLEFTPKEDEDFRLLMVVEGKDRPSAPKNRPNRLLESIGAAPDANRKIAASRSIVATTLDLLSNNRIASDSQPQDRAALANWLISQLALKEGDASRLSELVRSYSNAKEKLAAEIRTQSRVCMAMWDGTPADENLLIRGNHKTVGAVQPRRLLEALQGTEDRGQEKAEGTRLDLARQLVDRRSPLVSRVIVNRVWQHLMGRGIVPSVDNFGVLGEEPTHPELLDYLADEFIREGWSLKRLIRWIMLSSSYRQGSGVGVQESVGQAFLSAMMAAEKADPQNLLFHRQNMKRLEGETIRDAMLSISGQLSPKMYGPSVPVFLTPFMQGRGRPKESGPLDGTGRRSIYIAVRRNFLSPLMLAFDTPLPFTTIGRRNVSNVPAQALILMNDPFVAEQARQWARKLLAESKATPAARIGQMYLTAFGREPSADETAKALAFLDQQAGEYALSAQRATSDERVWADLAHVLFNVKGFVLVQ